MSIQDSAQDLWGTYINGIQLPINMYFLDNEIIRQNPGALAPINQSGQVLSMIYTPFLHQSDLELLRIPYDINYYGNPGGGLDYKVFRLNGPAQGVTLPIDINLGSIQLYPGYPFTVQKDWRNESKLQQYPYTYISINDYINSPLIIKSTFLPVGINKTFEVHLKQSISISGGYTIYVPGYKGDVTGSTEGLQSTVSMEMPTSSSQYAQFLASSKAQFFTANNIASKNEAFASYVNKANTTSSMVGGALSNIGSLNVLGALNSGIQAGMQYDLQNRQNALNKQNRIDGAMAFISDKKNSPRNVNMGSYDILQTLDISNRRLDYIKYEILDYYKTRLLDYFTLYGYKQNKYMKVDIRSRKYWNYVKTIGANIRTKNDMDKAEVEELKQIFDGGVTFWHYWNCKHQGIKMYDTRTDNKEVFL